MSARATSIVNPSIVHAANAVDVAGVAVCFINATIHPVIDSIVELAKFESADDGAFRRRLCLVLALAKVARGLIEDAGGVLEERQAELQATLDELKAGVA